MKSKMLSVNQAYALIVQDESQKMTSNASHVHHEGGSAAFFTARNANTFMEQQTGACCQESQTRTRL